MSASTVAPGGARVAVQKFGTFLSGMIMPNIPALIAWGLLTAMGAAFRFDYAEDAEVVELQRLLAEEPAEVVVGTVTGLEPDHPLYPAVLELVKSVQG